MGFFATTALGAFLLFLLQPLAARQLLPWFGGSPSVWTTCMLFFQVLLLAGYAYAHRLGTTLRPRSQVLVHAGLLAVAAIALAIQAFAWGRPLLPDAAFRPPDPTAPVVRLLLALGAGAGLPFLVLSATSPLVQSWYFRAHPARSPYRLYVLSNAGSLAALLAYPFVIERFLSLSQQAWLFSGLFAVFAVSCAGIGLHAVRAPAFSACPASAPPPVPSSAPGAVAPVRDRLLWLALSACGSALLLAVTNQVCQEVAVVPLLWVVPLAVYLSSFMLVFEREDFYRRPVFLPLLALGLVASTWTLLEGASVPVPLQAGAHLLALFTGTLVCHGELARLKPHAAQLTSFYLSISAGGALGGVAVAIIAPLVFSGFFELHASLLGCALLVAITQRLDPGSWLNAGAVALRRGAMGAGIVVLALVLFVAADFSKGRALASWRNFYGVLRVTEARPDDPERHGFILHHGATLHGIQPVAHALRREPTAYYTRESGLGLALLGHPRRNAPDPVDRTLRIGVVGQGVGTTAALAQPGDRVRFFEINPVVAAVAEGHGGWFSYLRDSPADIEVVLGDARISLERERAEGNPERYDVLDVDAFTSDAIPIHLLTREAIDLYLDRLNPGGVIAFHVTNRHLDLAQVLFPLAAEAGLAASLLVDRQNTTWSKGSTWLLASRDPEVLAAVVGDGPIFRPGDAPLGRGRVWTDDWSDLVGILKE